MATPVLRGLSFPEQMFTAPQMAVDPSVRSALAENPRAIKMTIDEAQTVSVVQAFPETCCLTSTFEDLAATLDEETACIVLLRLQDAVDSNPDQVQSSGWPGLKELVRQLCVPPSARKAEWGLLVWMPESASRKTKILCDSSRRLMKAEFRGLRIDRIYQTSQRSELTWEAFDEATQPADRNAVMGDVELTFYGEQCELDKPQAAAEREHHLHLPGFVLPWRHPQTNLELADSFHDSMLEMLAYGTLAVMGRLTGPDFTVLEEEVLRGVASPAALRGRLPQKLPRYVILNLTADDVLVVLWEPAKSPWKLMRKGRAYKSSFVELVKREVEPRRVTVVDVHEDGELNAALGTTA